MSTPSTRSEHPDSDLQKGAVESDQPNATNEESMAGQLSHRESDELIKENDSDFPGPGPRPEHSGQR